MKRRRSQTPLNDEKGNMLIIVVVIIMVLTSLGLYGLSATSIEIAASGSERRDKENFANAESGLKFAIANFNLIYNNSDNNDGFLYCSVQADEDGNPVTLSMGNAGIITTANTPCPGTPVITALRSLPIATGSVMFDYAINGTRIARVEIRSIMLNPAPIAGLSAMANDVPSRLHLSFAPAGFDSNEYKSRNYCITSTALDSQGNLSSSIVQSGIVIAAQKKSVDFLVGL